jgi:hypothetical protein
VGSEELRVLAEEQAALRRVATLVARGTRPEEVFAAVPPGSTTTPSSPPARSVSPPGKPALTRRWPRLSWLRAASGA